MKKQPGQNSSFKYPDIPEKKSFDPAVLRLKGQGSGQAVGLFLSGSVR